MPPLKCKISNERSETQIVEERRKGNINKMNKFSLHVTSRRTEEVHVTRNTCQAIVRPDCSKTDSSKADGIKDALLFVLCQTIKV